MFRFSKKRHQILGAIICVLSIYSCKAEKLELDELSIKEITERLAPIAQPCSISEPCAKSASYQVSAKSSGKSRTGEEIYTQVCATCHSIGLAGAPKKGNHAEWKKHMVNHGNNFNNMLKAAIEGVNAMPPKGGCVDCSDDDIKIAIEYMSGFTP